MLRVIRLHTFFRGALILVLLTLGYIYLFSAPYESQSHRILSPKPDLKPCNGARGLPLSESVDDQVVFIKNQWTSLYPKPLWGSYEALGLSQKWSTADGRYGPYGFGEELHSYNRTVVNWSQVDWAELQNQCFEQNRKHFPMFQKISKQKRFITRSFIHWIGDYFPKLYKERSSTGQTAIVLRTWDQYNYQPEDLWHIRSVITETALFSKGKYAVFLVVDVHDEDRRRRMHQSSTQYEAVIAETVPREFQSMAILFDETILESWYPLVDNHNAQFQMYQATQLFSTIYKFDYYWQLEMDARFLVHTDHYLSALAQFSQQEPRTQALQRAAYRYMPDSYSTYEDFMVAVDRGQSSPTRQAPNLNSTIPEIPQPMEPEPDFAAPNFSWGVGDTADVILTNTLVSVTDMTWWPYGDWIRGFSMGENTSRVQSPVSITRTSYRLLKIIHKAQMEQGLAVPSEATAPSFAFWNHLKISYPPAPWFMHHQDQQNHTEWEAMFNGGPVELAQKAPSLYNPREYWDYANDGTWHFSGIWPREIMDAWLANTKQNNYETEKELPWILRIDETGQVWAPCVALHPVKTN